MFIRGTCRDSKPQYMREEFFPSSSCFPLISLENWVDCFYLSAWYKVKNKENISKVRWYINQSIWQSVQRKIILRVAFPLLTTLSFLKAFIRVQNRVQNNQLYHVYITGSIGVALKRREPQSRSSILESRVSNILPQEDRYCVSYEHRNTLRV